MTAPQRIDTIVIGGGQAGLAVGYHLAKRKVPFLILDASERVGDAWRQRWDSLRLFSTRRYSQLDGMRLPGPGHGFPTKDEIADYLEQYASRFSLPVRSGVRVSRLGRAGDLFAIEAGPDRFEARNVVVAMATHRLPWIPEFAPALDASICQIHSARYRNPGDLQDGPTLVVGAGNSGGELALEVVAAGHDTFLAGDIDEHVPFRIESVPARYVLLPMLFRILAHHVLTVRTPIGRRRRQQLLAGRSPLVRVKPRELVAAGVHRTGRIVGVRDGGPILDDGTVIGVANVVWCTGFRPDFSWIDLPVVGEHEPDHHRGIVPLQPGLYFVGLPFLYAMSSGFLRGVSRDAGHVTHHIAARSARHKAGPIASAAAEPGSIGRDRQRQR